MPEWQTQKGDTLVDVRGVADPFSLATTSVARASAIELEGLEKTRAPRRTRKTRAPRKTRKSKIRGLSQHRGSPLSIATPKENAPKSTENPQKQR